MNWITITGLAAAACTTFSYVPQAIKIIKNKQTKDISLSMYIVMILGVGLWGAYGVALKELPIILANSITLVFLIAILILKIRYK